MKLAKLTPKAEERKTHTHKVTRGSMGKARNG